MLHGAPGDDPRAVHRARTASRRLRELLPLLQLEGRTAEKLLKRLRKVTRRLGRAREIDSMLQLVESGAAPGSPNALAQVRTALEERRERAREKAFTKRTAQESERLSHRLESLVEKLAAADARVLHPKVGRDWRWALDARIAHRASRLRAAIERAGAVYLPERLHVVRIALKKLRYGVELAAQADGLGQPGDLRLLKRVQGDLGHMHDLQVLMGHVRQVQGTVPATGTPRSTPWQEFDALVAALEDECRRLHGRFMRQRPTVLALCDRLSAPPVRAHRPAQRHTAAVRRAG